ncbi:MAG: Ion channel protein [Thermoleophilia bacterium]|nr:Ion channel protein [Thermoleophilia bacterium]
MRRHIDIHLPTGMRTNPLAQLGLRLAIGVALTILVTLGTWLERDGYGDSADGVVGLLDSLYYATVSITTTGYGDVVPVSDAARWFTTLVVTPARVVFLVLLVGTSVELIASASQNILRESRWRKRVRDHIVICGFGVKGRSALDSLVEHGERYDQVVVIDPDPEALAHAERLGCAGVHGDASSDENLLAARIERARVVIVTPNRDDAAVLTVLSVRNLNDHVHIVASARELENAPLLRRSGANVVLTSSGSTGRMLGLASVSPNYVHVVEELLEHGTGLDLVERIVAPDETGPLADVRREGELVISVFRAGACVARTPGGTFVLAAGDALVSVVAPPITEPVATA